MRQHKPKKIAIIGLTLLFGGVLFFGRTNLSFYQNNSSIKASSFLKPKVKLVADEKKVKKCDADFIKEKYGVSSVHAEMDANGNLKIYNIPADVTITLAVPVAEALGTEPYYYLLEHIEQGGNAYIQLGPAKPYGLGDVDGNGQITTQDYLMLTKYNEKMVELNPTQLLAADVNQDGKVNEEDASMLLKLVVHILPLSYQGGTIIISSGIWKEIEQQLSNTLGHAISAEPWESEIRFYPNSHYEDDKHVCEPTYELFYVIVEDFPEDLVYNLQYYGQTCTDFRNQYGSIPEMVEMVPYCFQEAVDENYDEGRLKNWIDSAVNGYKNRQASLSNSKQDLTTYANEVEVKNPNQNISLSCNPFLSDKTELVENKKYNQSVMDVKVNTYANVSPTYVHTTTKTATHGYCQSECKEAVIVKFQAPVAVQAGMCFTYQVEVESKIECKVKELKKKPVKSTKCIPRPSCYGTYDYNSDSSGPTEEFDRCVLECDGGKYGQKCINQCYKEVYQDGFRSENMLTYQEKTFDVKKIANENTPQCNRTFTSSAPTYQKSDGTSWSAEEIYQFRLKNPGGKYVVKEGKITWVPGGTCPSQAGYYYFSTTSLTKKTLQGFRNSYWNTGNKAYRHYKADENGFKRQNSVRYHCDSVCSWKGCTNPKLPTEVGDDYQSELDNYNSDWKECNEKTKCSTTTTSYTITVDQNNPTSPNHTEYQQEQKPGQEPSDTFVGSGNKKKNIKQNGIITDYSGSCYGREDGWVYRNVLEFSETFLANKNGLYTNLIPTNTSNYRWLGNQFCTSTKTSPVNVSWYNWKVNENGDSSKVTEKLKTAVAKERKDNINVHIGSDNNHLWGFSGWNFDVNCFYSVPEDPDCPCGKKDNRCVECPIIECACGEDKDGTCKICPTPTIPFTENYIFRPVDLNDLFPNNRKARFNWSCNATNLLNGNYPVQPEAAIDEIENKGNSIYSDDTELDYDILLNRATMKKVREYNEEHKVYTDYDGQEVPAKENTKGVTVYKSKFLSDLGTDVLKRRGLAGCNNQKGTACDTEIIQDNCSLTWEKGA